MLTTSTECIVCGKAAPYLAYIEWRTSEGWPAQQLDLPVCSLQCSVRFLRSELGKRSRSESIRNGFAKGHDLSARCDRCDAPAKLAVVVTLDNGVGEPDKSFRYFSCSPDCYECLAFRLTENPADEIYQRRFGIASSLRQQMRPLDEILQDALQKARTRKVRRGGLLR